MTAYHFKLDNGYNQDEDDDDDDTCDGDNDDQQWL